MLLEIVFIQYLGGEIVSTFDNPEKVKIGKCDLIEQITIGEDSLLRFSGVQLGEACTVVLRGATNQILDEAERSLHDALCVLLTHVREARTVTGAGAAETLMASHVLVEAQKISGKESLAVESFARALQQLPTIICDNAGLDSAEIISKLRAEHANGNHQYGVDIETGKVADVTAKGILESYNVKLCMLTSAAEAAEQVSICYYCSETVINGFFFYFFIFRFFVLMTLSNAPRDHAGRTTAPVNDSAPEDIIAFNSAQLPKNIQSNLV